VLGRAGWCQDVSSAGRRQVGGSTLRLQGFSLDVVVEHFNRSLDYEDLYGRQITNTIEFAAKTASFPATINQVRPRQTLGQRMPLSPHRERLHRLRPPCLQ